MTRGLILFAHGARDAAWAAPFESVAALMRLHEPMLQVHLAYLEFMTPTLADAGTSLAAAGCGHVDLVPMFLGTGGHVRRDLPVLVEQMRAQHPEVVFTLHGAIGEVRSVHQAMAEAVAQMLAASPPGATR